MFDHPAPGEAPSPACPRAVGGHGPKASDHRTRTSSDARAVVRRRQHRAEAHRARAGRTAPRSRRSGSTRWTRRSGWSASSTRPTCGSTSQGVIVRARRVQGREDDSVVKLRPVVPDELPAQLRAAPGMVVELDAMPGGYVCSASMKARLKRRRSEASACAASARRASCSPSHSARSTSSTRPTGSRWTTSRCWGRSSCSSSTRRRRASAASSARRCGCIPTARASSSSRPSAPRRRCSRSRPRRAAFLAGRGIDLSGRQQTKTKTALQQFSQSSGNWLRRLRPAPASVAHSPARPSPEASPHPRRPRRRLVPDARGRPPGCGASGQRRDRRRLRRRRRRCWKRSGALRPDVVITDVRMPPSGDDEGIRVAQRAARDRPGDRRRRAQPLRRAALRARPVRRRRRGPRLSAQGPRPRRPRAATRRSRSSPAAAR